MGEKMPRRTRVRVRIASPTAHLLFPPSSLPPRHPPPHRLSALQPTSQPNHHTQRGAPAARPASMVRTASRAPCTVCKLGDGTERTVRVRRPPRPRPRPRPAPRGAEPPCLIPEPTLDPTSHHLLAFSSSPLLHPAPQPLFHSCQAKLRAHTPLLAALLLLLLLLLPPLAAGRVCRTLLCRSSPPLRAALPQPNHKRQHFHSPIPASLPPPPPPRSPAATGRRKGHMA